MTFVDKIIERGIIFLLIFTPLAFGTVQQWSTAVMEIVAFSIFFLYVIKRILEMPAQCHSSAELIPEHENSESQSRSPGSQSSGGKLGNTIPISGEIGLCPPIYPRGLTVLFILLAAMIALALFQMVPLPEGLLKLISPASLSTYATFGNAPAGAYHPVSLNPDATRRELFRVLAYAAIFFVIISHYRTKEQVHSLVKTILWIGCFLVIFAIVQNVTWNGRVFWIYPVDEALKSGKGIWGPYINRNHFAGYLGMTIPLGLGLLLYSAPRVKALPESALGLKLARFLASEKFVPYALLFLLLLVMTASLFMTFSRGGMIAFVVSSLFFARITWRRRTLRSKTGLLSILAVVIFAAVVLAAWDRLAERFADLDEGHVNRLNIALDSIGIVRDYPILGTGLGTFESAYMRYQTIRPTALYDHAHNDYVELVTDTGIFSLLLAAGMALVFFRMAFRRWRRKHGMFGKCIGAGGLTSFVYIATHSFTDFNLHIPANALLFAVITALTYAALFNVTERTEK